MLVIKAVRVQFQKNVIPIKIKKMLIGYKDTLLSNRKKYQQLDSHTFQWSEDITLPLYYNVPVSYSCKVDQDLYNPEDPNFQLMGSMKIVDYKANAQEGSLFNKQNRKVATLTISYRVSNQKLLIPQEKGVAVISSILAHINNLTGSSGFIQIKLDNKQIFTPTVKVIAGQLLWAEQLTLPVEQIKDSTKNKHEVVFSVYIDEQLAGRGSFSLTAMQKNNLKYKKFDIMSISTHEKIGTLFIDVAVRNRSTLNQTLAMKLKNQISQALISKRKTEEVLIKRQPSQHFFNQKQVSEKKFQLPTGVQSSRSESKLPHNSYNSDQTAKVLQKYTSKKKKNYDIFDQIFDYGALPNKQQDIRIALRQRRKKAPNESSLPKIR